MVIKRANADIPMKVFFTSAVSVPAEERPLFIQLRNHIHFLRIQFKIEHADILFHPRLF